MDVQITAHETCASSPREIKVLAIYEKEGEEKKAVALANGCHVLVTTPPSLVRILTGDSPVTNLDRCCHLMVEKADVTFDRFADDVHVQAHLRFAFPFPFDLRFDFRNLFT